MESSSVTGLIARFDLRNNPEGSSVIHVTGTDLDLPPGVVMTHVNPPAIKLRIARRGPPQGHNSGT
jgi:hypothetical protein